jgi:poly-gamma-glutamate synthesis protein (capsule biosynthesis protein)
VVTATPPADQFVAAPVAGPVDNAPCSGVRCVTIALSGDVLLHPQLIGQARQDAGDGSTTTVDGMDFFPMLAAEQKYVRSADIGICHLEIPLADPHGPSRTTRPSPYRRRCFRR